MKNRILVLSMVLALVAVMAVPMTALAVDTTAVTGTVAATPTVTSVTANTGNVSTTPTIAIVGTGFVTGETSVSLTGAAGVTAGTVTFTDSTHISSTFTIAADAAAGARNVYVTVAGKISTEVVTFTVNPFITVGAPPAIDLGYLTAGTTETGSSLTGSVTTNDDVWSVSAIDAKVTDPVSAGYMTRDGTLATALAAKFKIGKVAETLVDASTAITYTQADTTPLVLELYVSQVVASDAVAGSYQITITFTGSN